MKQLINADHVNDDFGKRIEEIRAFLCDYLKWFEVGPQLAKENTLPKMEWDCEKDQELPCRYIIRLGNLLAKLRGAVPTWETKDAQGSEYAYSIATIEDSSRAITQLKNLAKGHALSQGRNYIALTDIPLIVQVVLSTASLERITIAVLMKKKKSG